MTAEVVPPRVEFPAQPRGWILVVVSHAHLRNLLLRVLEVAGYTALGCARLSEVESSLQGSDLPRLILFDAAEASDEVLPQRLEHLYALLPLEEALCPILVLSSMHPPPRAQSLPGRVKVMVKPFNLAHLLDLVASQIALPEA
jgi:DNA-binding response OmpR family regulator